MIAAVIFDMDGLMIDSEIIQSRAFAYIIEKYGKRPKKKNNGLVHVLGIRERENLELLAKEYGVKEDVHLLFRERGKYYQKLLRKNVKPMPGLVSLIAKLRKKKVMLGVASSSARENIDIVLRKLKLYKVFEVVVSGNSLVRGKPYPDIFLQVATFLQVRPQDCVVLEDAENGVVAGKRAGMKVIAVPNRYTLEQDFSEANVVVGSLEKVNWKLLSSL